MQTGNITTWTGDLSEIGPLYPFVGSEYILLAVTVVLWLLWHYWQSRIEKKEYDDEVELMEQKHSVHPNEVQEKEE